MSHADRFDLDPATRRRPGLARRARLTAAGAEGAAWPAAVAAAVDVLFRQRNTAPGWVFGNPRVHAVTAR